MPFAVRLRPLVLALPLLAASAPVPTEATEPGQIQSSAFRAGANGQLRITLHGIRDASGNLRVSLYDQADGFRKEDKAFRQLQVPAQPGELGIVFDELPPGRYAVMAYHDANADQRLNLRLGMFPIEGYGLSNNPKVFGPPKFDNSAFEVVGGDETEIKVEIRY